MSIFRSIMNGIFGRGSATAAEAPATAEAAKAPAASPSASPAAAAAAATAPAVDAGAPAAPGQQVDVAAVLTEMQAKSGQTLNWRQSIVDLMKLLGLDSSLAARKELAKELGYTGSTDDSAAMNVWLHKQVMRKLAENGGKVPDDLK